MKKLTSITLVLAGTLGAQAAAFAQEPREDFIWARRSLNPITLDGNLNEPGWAQAESWTIRYGQDAGIPGSGWKVEGGLVNPTNPTFATLKFLTFGNQLYLGATVADSSVGGSAGFNRFDGFLMALKAHDDAGFP